MPSLDTLLAFLGLSILITLAPGPDILMVLGLGMARGRHAGMAFGLGCASGCLSHTVLAAVGISAVIAASPWAFLALKLTGGAYLAWLGVRMLRRPDLATTSLADSGGDAWTLFRRGLLANAVNPKVILFFLAFLPQFVAADRGGAALQTLTLGGLFAVQAAVLFGTLGAAAGHLGRLLSRRPAVSRWLNRLAGLTFLGLGARLALGR